MNTERPKGRQPIPESAKKVFSGVLFDVYQWDQEQFDGTTATFEKLKRQDTVCVIPVLPEGKLLLIEDEQPGRDMVITFPGGRIDGNEAPDVAVRRELLEETGYEPGELVLWKATQPVSKLDWVLYIFIARGCRKVGEPHFDAGERIKTREVTLDECLELVDHPQFQSGDLGIDFIKAKYDAEERQKLDKLLSGK